MSEWPSKDMEIAVRAERLEELQEKEDALTEKVAVIKALADALESLLQDGHVAGWCGSPDGEPCDGECAEARAALRLVGRLP